MHFYVTSRVLTSINSGSGEMRVFKSVISEERERVQNNTLLTNVI
jgi:hypothetical protein